MNDSKSTASPALGWTWSNVDPAAHFAADYAEARAKFLAAATPAWKAMVYGQARAAALQALSALSLDA